MAAIHQLEVHPQGIGLGGEPRRVQVGVRSGHHRRRARHPLQCLECLDRTVEALRTEDEGLGLRPTGQLDRSVLPVAEAPSHVAGQYLRIQRLHRRPGAVRGQHRLPVVPDVAPTAGTDGQRMVGSDGTEVLLLTGPGLDGDGLTEDKGGDALRCCDRHLDANGPAERHPQDGEVVDAQMVGDRQHVESDGVIAEEAGIRHIVAASVPPEVDADDPATLHQPTGQGVVHAGAEPVRMQEEEWRARASPVQVGDPQAIADHTAGDRRVGHRWHVLRSSGGHGVDMGGSLADHPTP